MNNIARMEAKEAEESREECRHYQQEKKID
jgi:hypothetical protein